MATEVELDAAIADLKLAINDKVTTLEAQIAELVKNNPDLTDEIADIQATAASLRQPVTPTP